jgi:hypothetical protein
MALRNPVAIYNAANNAEVYLVQDALAAAGIEAYITEDNSAMGLWALGMLPGIHKPQVWVERDDVERAKPILEEFERRKAELNTTETKGIAPDVRAHCEECDKYSFFPAAQVDSVQQCPHCGGFVDVGDERQDEEWEAAEGESEHE